MTQGVETHATAMDRGTRASAHPQPWTVWLSPDFEGATVRMWIGFKHFLYLAERAAYEYLATRGASPRDLFWQQGSCLQVIASSLRVRSAMMYGERVLAAVQPTAAEADGTLHLQVTLTSERLGTEWRLATSQLTLAAIDMTGARRPLPAAVVPAGRDGRDG